MFHCATLSVAARLFRWATPVVQRRGAAGWRWRPLGLTTPEPHHCAFALLRLLPWHSRALRPHGAHLRRCCWPYAVFWRCAVQRAHCSRLRRYSCAAGGAAARRIFALLPRSGEEAASLSGPRFRSGRSLSPAPVGEFSRCVLSRRRCSATARWRRCGCAAGLGGSVVQRPVRATPRQPALPRLMHGVGG